MREDILHYYVYIISVLLKYYTYGSIYIYNSDCNNIIYLELELKHTSLNSYHNKKYSWFKIDLTFVSQRSVLTLLILLKENLMIFLGCHFIDVCHLCLYFIRRNGRPWQGPHSVEHVHKFLRTSSVQCFPAAAIWHQ